MKRPELFWSSHPSLSKKRIKHQTIPLTSDYMLQKVPELVLQGKEHSKHFVLGCRETDLVHFAAIWVSVQFQDKHATADVLNPAMSSRTLWKFQRHSQTTWEIQSPPNIFWLLLPPMGYAGKPITEWCPGDILIRCPNHLTWLLLIQRSSGSSPSSSRTSLLVTYNGIFSTSVLNHPRCCLCKRDKWLDVFFFCFFLDVSSIIHNFSDKHVCLYVVMSPGVCVWMCVTNWSCWHAELYSPSNIWKHSSYFQKNVVLAKEVKKYEWSAT